jgi:hypothetical protein
MSLALLFPLNRRKQGSEKLKLLSNITSIIERWLEPISYDSNPMFFTQQ